MKKKHGQVLILVLLVVVVALAVGLSVASRNLTNLRTTTQTEQSQKAFNAAEGGIEDTLAKIGSVPIGTSFFVPVGDLTANVTVQQSSEYISAIDEGNVGQVDLNGASGTLKIEWVKSGDPQEDRDNGGIPASIEVTQVYNSGGVINQTREAWTGGSDDANAKEVGFKNPGGCVTSEFKLCAIMPIESNPLLLRIRPFWNRTTVKVTSVDGSLAPQIYNITSTATTELGLTRKIQVTKTVLPQLPAVFDYALYSEGGITK